MLSFLSGKSQQNIKKCRKSMCSSLSFKLVLKLSLCFGAHCCRSDSEIDRKFPRRRTINLSAKGFLFPKVSMQQLFIKCLLLGRGLCCGTLSSLRKQSAAPLSPKETAWEWKHEQPWWSARLGLELHGCWSRLAQLYRAFSFFLYRCGLLQYKTYTGQRRCNHISIFIS